MVDDMVKVRGRDKVKGALFLRGLRGAGCARSVVRYGKGVMVWISPRYVRGVRHRKDIRYKNIRKSEYGRAHG